MSQPKPFEFSCATCGEVHSGSPSFSFDAPFYYYAIPEAERPRRTRLNPDLCAIDKTSFFVRVVLELPIHGARDPFTWGVWASLSREDFGAYIDTLSDETHTGLYHGWLSNRLPYYPDTLSIKSHVRVQPGELRPILELEPVDHPLCVDAHEGLSWQKAVRIAQTVMHGEEKGPQLG